MTHAGRARQALPAQRRGPLVASYQIETMSRAELDLVVSWAAAEGWEPGLHDADCYHHCDPHGFLLGRLGDRPIASISAVRYGDAFGFIGFYIVQPEYRGQGYGKRLWDAALARLAGRTIGLDGVVAQQARYRQAGFTLAHRNLRCQGSGGGAASAESGLEPLGDVSLAELAAYDRAFFPSDRLRFLECWIRQPCQVGFAVRQGGALAGFGLLRPSRSGFRIGPLYADRIEFAERLWWALCGQVPAGAPVFLDIPLANPDAVDLVQRLGLRRVFETARMYRGQFPVPAMSRWYGVTTFELG